MANLAQLEAELAQRDFREFLRYVWILDPPPEGRGHIRFEFWPYMEDMLPRLLGHRLLVWLKARQTAASWTLAAYALWRAQYDYGAKVVLISQGQEEAKKLLEKCHYIWQWLPPLLKRTPTVDNRETMAWGDNLLEALPSTPKAGRSGTNTLVIMDEADNHEYLYDDYYGIKPTIDNNGGQLILVSTSNKYKSNSLFKTLYRGAPGNGFHAMFYPWSVRPGRDESWYERTKAQYPDPWLFEGEYPNTAEQALAAASSLMAFDPEALEEARANTCAPVRSIGGIRLFQLPQVGHRYTAASDTSHGVGGDYSVTAVLDVTNGRGVADVFSNVIHPDEFTVLSIDMLKRYGAPIWAVEDNEWGILTVRRAQELGYPRLFHQKEGKPGFHTGLNRSELWGELQEAVRDRLVAPLAPEGVAQMYDLIRNPSKMGRIEAREGANDDYPIALAIAWAMRHRATRLTARDTPRMETGNIYKW